jgi:hypothetical protein
MKNDRYDLGEVDDLVFPIAMPPGDASAPLPVPGPGVQAGRPATLARPAGRPKSPTPIRPASRRVSSGRARSTRTPPVLVPASAAIFVPGAGHLLQARFKAGLIWFGSTIFVCAVMALIWIWFPRVWQAAGVLGLPRAVTVWLLASFAGLLAVLQVTSVLAVRIGSTTDQELHPAIACCASAAVPGWGQVLNGDLIRAGLFLVGVWATAAVWLLASTPLHEFLATHGLYLPEHLSTVVAGPTAWVLPAALWPLAIYDAGASACWARL